MVKILMPRMNYAVGEREERYHAIEGKEKAAMLAQYIREKGFNEGIAVGLVEGGELGIAIGLRFGAGGLKLMDTGRQIRNLEQLKALKEAVKAAQNLADFEAALDATPQ